MAICFGGLSKAEIRVEAESLLQLRLGVGERAKALELSKEPQLLAGHTCALAKSNLTGRRL